MTFVEYDKMPDAYPRRERVVAAYTDAIAGGVDKDKAIMLIAVSDIESRIIWNRKRSTAVIASDCPCSTMVGLELLNGRIRVTDPFVTSWLKKRGWATGSGATLSPSGPLAVPGSYAIAQFFEMVMLTRRSKLLVNFSLGPTQMHLFWSKVAGTGKVQPAFPDTWEALWDFYTAEGVAALMKKITYLDAPTCKYPKPSVLTYTDDSAGSNWASCQAGSLDGGKGYWLNKDVPWTTAGGVKMSGDRNFGLGVRVERVKSIVASLK